MIGGGALLAVGLVGSFVSGSFGILVATRVFQAVGSGIFIPLMMTAALHYAPEGRVGTYLAVGSGCTTIGPAVSPVISGAMATALGWRAVFLIPLVLAALTMVAGIGVRGSLSQGKVAIDVLSVMLVALAVVALVGGISAFAASVLAGVLLLMAAVLLGWLFVRRQGKAKNPLLNLRPLRRLRFAGACALNVCLMMVVFSMSVILMLYYQGSCGMNGALAGALLIFPVLANAATALVAGRLYDAHGPWPVIPAGFAVVMTGQAVVVGGALAGWTWLVVAGAMASFAGVGLAFSTVQTFGLTSLPVDQNPSGVSLINLLVQVAASVGPALFVGIMSAVASPAMGTDDYPAMLAQGFALSGAVSALLALAALAFAFWLVRRAR